ncbi:hypothetical protein A7A08_00280 [Methyloligella halotolerans]|uniref:Cytochrome c domain-containing protein n=1 Tax=Methyloligella halotolerans TaxID=1177755 RepID=A0A1E2S1U5_9HYPH|nr:hypothetical protein [Methyloligella halotolerans]ODA68457.1 hypothetical protein A7A08_00280 [Methyloligella halotolerans]
MKALMRHAPLVAFCLTIGVLFLTEGVPWVVAQSEAAPATAQASTTAPSDTSDTAVSSDKTGETVEVAEDETSSSGDDDQKAGAAADGAPEAADKASDAVECCKPGDQTPPTELVEKIPPGGLHSPYPDYKKMAADDPKLVVQFRLPGCNECHGGTGGGGFCPALSQGVWFWGNTDDVLFRLITLGSDGLEKQGFYRRQWGSVHAGMPAMGHTIKTADHLWKIIAFIRSINPPGTNPPEKVIPGKMELEDWEK